MIYFLIVGFVACLFVLFHPGAKSLRFYLLHGPIIDTRIFNGYTARQYADGTIHYVDPLGHVIDLMAQLYYTPRTWHLCSTSGGEGTSTMLHNCTFDEMQDAVAKSFGALTFVDIFTGIVAYKAK
jgi:hypothetical protein